MFERFFPNRLREDISICFLSTMMADSIAEADELAVFEKHPDYDYVLLTNLNPEDFNTSWDVIRIDDGYVDKYRKNITRSRFPKFMGWHYLKEKLNKDYDVIFYCDAIKIPKKKTNWIKIANSILSSDSGIIQQPHVKGRNIYDECDLIAKCRKDSLENANKTKSFFKENNVPIDIPMMRNTCFGYDPKNEKLQNAFQKFWDLYSEEKLTHRDQPLWGYISWKYDIDPITHKNFFKYFADAGKWGFDEHIYN